MDKIIWIFGAGSSLACNLKWDYPQSYNQLLQNLKDETLRDNCISEIITTLTNAQENPVVSTQPHRMLVKRLNSASSGKLKHRIVTTNWDLLLEKEITFRISDTCPEWLVDSHVFHLNGTIEKGLEANGSVLPRRSTFLLPCDPHLQRRKTVESNNIFNSLLWAKRVIVVGMSFECSLDKGFLGALSRCEDETPIGEATWVLVNSCQSTLEQIEKNILKSFPAGKVIAIHKEYEEWVRGTMEGAFP